MESLSYKSENGTKILCSLFCHYGNNENNRKNEDIAILITVSLIILGFCILICQCFYKIFCQKSRELKNTVENSEKQSSCISHII